MNLEDGEARSWLAEAVSSPCKDEEEDEGRGELLGFDWENPTLSLKSLSNVPHFIV